MNKRPVLPKNVASAGPASEGVGLLGQAGGHGQPGQGGAFGPAAAVVGGAGLEGGKLAAGGGLVPVDLPAAHALAPLAPVADKARHVLRGIAQEEADLMGKVPAGPQAAAEFRQAGPLAQVPVARLAEQAADLLLGQVPGTGRPGGRGTAGPAPSPGAGGPAAAPGAPAPGSWPAAPPPEPGGRRRNRGRGSPFSSPPGWGRRGESQYPQTWLKLWPRRARPGCCPGRTWSWTGNGRSPCPAPGFRSARSGPFCGRWCR